VFSQPFTVWTYTKFNNGEPLLTIRQKKVYVSGI
jgi:hypothetical protein